MFADSVKRNLLGFLPSRETPDHFVVGISPGKVREFYVDDLSDFPLGNLPTIRYRDAREKRKDTVAGRSRLLHRQFGPHIISLHSHAEFLAHFAQRRSEERLVFGIVFAARESDLSAMHAAGIA